MAQQDLSGWESLGTNDPTRYKALFRLDRTQGVGVVKQNVRVIINRSNGNYDVYETNFGASDKLIYSYNASNNFTNIVNLDVYNQLFARGDGGRTVSRFNKSIRESTLALAESNVTGGAESQSTKDLQKLKSLNGYKSLANTSTEDLSKDGDQQSGNGDQQSGGNGRDTSEPTYTSEELQALVNEGITGVGIKENYGNLRYPEKMTDMDCVVFTARQYGTRGFNVKNTGFAKIETRIGKTLGTAALSIQPSLRDTNTVKWSGLEMSIFDQAFADLSLSTMSGGGEGARAFIDRALNTVNTEGENLKNAILTKLAESAVGTQGLLSRLTGAVFNPNLELLFQGPELRTFNFNFNLSPRNGTEAAQVKAIINFFKRNMAVQRTPAELFLKAPNVFEIKYTFAGRKDLHPSLNKIKFCALTSCSVDYTPSNSYMTFNDGLGTPVQYNLSMTFQELEPVFEDEYEGHDIGY